MPGQFDKESSVKNFEWHRERALREKKKGSIYANNRVDYNLKAIASKHGDKAAQEVAKEFNSNKSGKKTKYFT